MPIRNKINIAKDIFYLCLAEGGIRLSGFGIFIIATRYLSTVQLAEYLVLFSYTNLCWLISNLGSSTHGVRTLCEKQSDFKNQSFYISNILLLRLILAGFVTFSFLFIYRIFIPQVALSAVLVSMTSVLFKALTIDWILRSYNKVGQLTKIMTLSSLLGLVFGFFLIKSSLSSTAALFAHAFVALILLIGTWIVNFRELYLIPAFNCIQFKLIRRILVQSGAIGLSGFAALSAQTVPLFALNIYNEVENVAIFGGVQRLLQIILGLLTILSLAHFPNLARNRNDKFNFTSAYSFYTADLMFISLLLFTFFGMLPEISLKLLLGNSYCNYKDLFILMICIFPLLFIRTAFTDSLIAKHKTFAVLFSCFLGLLISTILCFVILPIMKLEWQIYIALLAIFSSEIAIIIISIFFLLNYYGLEIFKQTGLRLVISLLFLIGSLTVYNLLKGINYFLPVFILYHILGIFLVTLLWCQKTSIYILLFYQKSFFRKNFFLS